MSPAKVSSPIRLSALLIDLSGTLHIDDQGTPRAVDALQKLRRSGLPFRFCSNTSKESTSSLLARLRRIGFEIAEDELYTSLKLTLRIVEEQKLRPYLILSDSALEEFKSLGLPCPDEECDGVVMGFAPERLDYASLNTAFRILAREPLTPSFPRPSSDAPRALIATHEALYLKSSSGLSLGPGAFLPGLAAASGVTARIVGKPSEDFFNKTLESLGELDSSDGRVVGIVGDDVKNDLGGGALSMGMRRFLVKTGKYRAGDETKGDVSDVYDDFASLIDALQL